MIGLRTYLEVGAVLIIVIAFALYSAHERGVGAQGIEKADERAVAGQLAKDQKTVTADAAISRQEDETYAKAIATAVAGAPVIRVCVDPPRPVLTAAQADYRPRADALAVVRGANPPLPAVLEWHTDEIVQIGHDADAQIAGLQDYITRVCPTL